MAAARVKQHQDTSGQLLAGLFLPTRVRLNSKDLRGGKEFGDTTPSANMEGLGKDTRLPTGAYAPLRLVGPSEVKRPYDGLCHLVGSPFGVSSKHIMAA